MIGPPGPPIAMGVARMSGPHNLCAGGQGLTPVVLSVCRRAQ